MSNSDSDSDSEFSKSWVEWFLSIKGNEFFCEVDEEYMLDFFNLTGLNAEIPCFQEALELITDNLGTAQFPFIQEKHRRKEFGVCPRVLCANNPLLPVGIYDAPKQHPVVLYCGLCEDIYNVRQNKYKVIDGAYFGTTFPHMFYDTFPALKTRNTNPDPHELRYEPKIFGFKVHSIAKLHRWQDDNVKKEKLLIDRLSKNS
ncbi:hypothetical protein BB560_006552 [Smittium megazygosporum]|uniref:Casein kinase II subunit beta n=1 Tax=Smittium megazygosporum TaxID=133381 RepID=A0A2T9Y431_9FUNG|nr:hypothetical protein BB560_006552 [Smittium megazygosporum]